MRWVRFTCCAALVGIASTAACAASPAAAVPGLSSDAASSAVVTTSDDRAAFDAGYPQARRIDFADAAGRTAPFAIGAVRFSGGNAQTLDRLVDLPANFWFGAQTTSPEFLLSNLTVEIAYPWPVRAVGFDVQCFACDAPDQPTPLTAVLLNDSGDLVGYEQIYPTALTGVPAGTPAFVAIDSDVPFKSIVLHRDANWLMMNFRYVPAMGSRTGAD